MAPDTIVVEERGAIQIAELEKELESTAPKIRNLGNGPALDITVHWTPRLILSEALAVSEPNLLRPNDGPVRPANLSKDERAGVYLFPACLNSASASKIKMVSGDLEIRYSDASGGSHVTTHAFEVHVMPDEKRMALRAQLVLPFNWREF